MEKEVRRMGQKQNRIRQKEQQDYRQKNKAGYTEKWDQTGIPDRGETSEIPGLPPGEMHEQDHVELVKKYTSKGDN